MELNQFIDRWCDPDYPPDRVSSDELAKVEKHFRFKFPEEYRVNVLTFGLPRLTMDLLDTIVDYELDLPDLSELLSPAQIIESTEGWRPLGLPHTGIAIASDCMGNLFYLDPTQSPSAIWFFDHDFGEVRQIAGSFGEWIKGYNTINHSK